MTEPLLGFIPKPILLSLLSILPARKLPEGLKNSRKFSQILASIKSIGLIEPLVVSKPDRDGNHIILDGHIRYHILKILDQHSAFCIVALDEESYTYNNRINRLTSIQEHIMMRRAVERGVSPEKIARALNVDVDYILRKVRLLDGICSEAADLLADHTFSAHVTSILRQMKPIRQVECVELMLSANNLSVVYARALLAATPENMLAEATVNKKIAGVNAEQMTKMEREMGSLHQQLKLAEQTYSQDVLNLVLAKGYLAKLLGNESIYRYLSKKQPDLLSEFDSLISMTTLN